MAKQLPTLDWLNEELRYEPGTGCFFWKIKRSGRDMYRPVGWTDAKGYRNVTLHRAGGFKLHRLAWLMGWGAAPPDGATIDHINGDRADNRLVNLRLATHSEQSVNSKQRASGTGFRGVTRLSSATYQARISFNGERRFLGNFPSAKEASAAYNRAAKDLHGDFARAE